jgi:hypothetical protein
MAHDRSELAAQIARAVTAFDWEKVPEWGNIKALSSLSTLEGVQVDPAGIDLADDSFSGVMSVNVLLQYDAGNSGAADEQAFADGESFLGHFTGHFDANGSAIVDQVSVEVPPSYFA